MTNRRWIVSAGLALMIVACISAAWVVVQMLPGHRGYASEVGTRAASRLDVQAQDATIILLPERGDRVRVTATGRYSSHRPVVSARSVNSVTHVVAQCSGRNEICNLTIRVWLPPDLDVTAHSDNGTIQADQLSGSLRLSSLNGEIHVTDSSGPLSLQTENSGIDIDNSRSRRLTATSQNGGIIALFRTPPDFVNASSQNGTVDITVPQQSYAITAHTTNGHTDIGPPNSASASHKLIATSVNADVVVQYGS